MRTRSTPARALAALGPLALLVTVLAGCLHVDADLTIDGDTVSGTLLTAIDKEAAELLELDPADVFASENEQFTNLEGVSTEPYDDGTWAGTELTFDRVDIAELNALSEGQPDGLRIRRDGEAGSYELTMVLDFSWMTELTEQQEAAQAQGVDVAALLERFEVTVAVTFPGEVTEHNGQLSGNTITWQAAPEERTELRAVAQGYEGAGDPPAPAPTSSPAGPATPPAGPDEPASAQEPDGDSAPAWPLFVAAGLGAVALAAAAGWWFYLRPRRNPDDSRPAPEPPPSS